MLPQDVSNEPAKRAFSGGMAGDAAPKERIAVRRFPSGCPDNVKASSQLDIANDMLRTGLEFIDNANPTHPKRRLEPSRSSLNLLRRIHAREPKLHL
jgi:hypothetical protein